VTPEQIATVADAVDKAELGRCQIRSVSLDHPGMTIDDAYAVQRAWIDLKVGRGARVRGRKIGLTSRAMQQAMKIDEPDYGVLLDDMFFESGAKIRAAAFTDPRIEVELAFVLRAPLAGEHVTLDDALAATEYVVPALELIAARTHRVDPETGRARGVLDTISDNAANAGVIVARERVAPDAVDLRWVAALLYQNGSIEESGVAAAVLDHPANGLVWLARRLARHGEGLAAGDFVLAGSFTRPVAVSAGDVIRADYGPLGAIECTFV
jgi:2-oxo-hept-3-ene-1,7-dioate hydratase